MPVDIFLSVHVLLHYQKRCHGTYGSTSCLASQGYLSKLKGNFGWPGWCLTFLLVCTKSGKGWICEKNILNTVGESNTSKKFEL